MLIHAILCAASVVATAVVYAVCPTLSAWWIPLLLIGAYAVGVAAQLTVLFIYSCFMRQAMPSAARRRFYRFISATAEWVVLLGGTRVFVRGVEKLPVDRPFLLVCNHRSAFDPLTTAAALKNHDLAWVSKPENFRIPLIGAIMRRASYLPIDRENPRKAVTTIKQAAQYISERALNIGIYPEGTRNKESEELLDFHNGSFKIATTAKCPVAVLALRYEKGRFPYRLHAYIEVAEILDADYIAGHRTDTISERARAIIEQALAK